MTHPGRNLRRLRASEIHAGEQVRVIAIESVRYDAGRQGSLYRLFARIEPTAMVVSEGGLHRVISLLPGEPSLDDLQRDVPGLSDLLAGNRR